MFHDVVRFMSRALDALPEPLVLIDKGGRCLFSNEAMKVWFGGDPVAMHSTDGWLPGWRQLASGQSEISSEIVTRKGGKVPAKLGVSPIGEGVSLVRVLTVGQGQDAPSQFHAQRLHTLGILAGGVAHDFNNILAGILGHVTYLKTILPATGPHVESLAAVEEGGKKASVITQQILNFSRQDSGAKPTRVNLNDLVTRTCSLLRGAISPVYQLRSALLETPGFVLASEATLAQVVVNLVINARDALGQNGEIVVALRRERDQELLRRVFESEDLPSHEYAVLSVRDNGHGMSQEVLRRIFEPYFSTKKEKGTGLGLATVSSIVRALGGAIQVATEVGKGTEISVFLPEVAAPEQEELSGKRRQRRRLEGGDERILVIDDEIPVRNVLSVSLRHLGYTVKTAGSGEEALALFESEQPRFDLVISDMLMPQMPGDKVFFKLKELQDDVRVLLMSGYSSNESVQRVLDNGGIDFIQKPFTIEELATKVRQCLDV